QTLPVSGRSSPAMTIKSVDLPEPDGPTIPIASRLHILRPLSFRMWTRAAPRPSERLTPLSAIAAPLPRGGLSFMRGIRWPVGNGAARVRTYGYWPGLVQRLLVIAAISGAFANVAVAQERTLKIVA